MIKNIICPIKEKLIKEKVHKKILTFGGFDLRWIIKLQNYQYMKLSNTNYDIKTLAKILKT